MHPGNSMEVAALQRKLTTILVADVAGYSRLMECDEEGTHARVSAFTRDVLDPAIGAHGGNLIKGTGDGVLAEFASVVEAVRCAIEIQQGATARNAGLPPDQHIAYRIGINSGDIIVEPDDIYGDGVNIAARLEALAEPGGIVVSRSVRDHVRDRLKLSFDDLGEQVVKNIPRPVRALRICVDANESLESPHPIARGLSRRALRISAIAFAVTLSIGLRLWSLNHSDALSGAAKALLNRVSSPATLMPRLSIVVLPFTNLGDPQQDYFVDGITDSLTTDFSRALPGSFVVARGTAFTYKGKPVDAGQVGRDLNVRYSLQGSVLTDGDQVRVNAQLIDAETNAQVWAERFDSKRKDVLEIQDRIVGRLSRAVGLELVDIEAKRSEREHPSNPTAVDLVMRGQAIANRPASPQTMITARSLFQRALEHDADNVDALAGLGTTYVFEVPNSYYEGGREERLRQRKELAGRALAIEPRHIVALKLRAALFRAEGDFDDAITASKAVITQNPGEPWAYKEVGLSKLYLGLFEEALDWFERANQIGPHDPSRWI